MFQLDDIFQTVFRKFFPSLLEPRRMVFESEQPPFALGLALPYCGRADIPANGHPQRMTHAPTPRPSFDDPASRSNTEFVHDERDIGQVDDLGSVWQGEGPEGGGWAEEVDEACMWCWGGHSTAESHPDHVVVPVSSPFRMVKLTWRDGDSQQVISRLVQDDQIASLDKLLGRVEHAWTSARSFRLGGQR